MIELTEKEKEEIEQILKRMQVADHVIKGGLNRMIENWENFVVSCEEEGYGLPMDDYLNDLDGREIIQSIIDMIDDSELSRKVKIEIKEYDDRFRKLLVDTDKNMWGKMGGCYDKEKHFWYFGIVKTAKDELLDDAISHGFNLK